MIWLKHLFHLVYSDFKLIFSRSISRERTLDAYSQFLNRLKAHANLFLISNRVANKAESEELFQDSFSHK